jgi:type VI secretion system protein ImpA
MNTQINIEDLLKPISTERPTGKFLRYEGIYQQIKEAAREDDPSLPQKQWKKALKKADWKLVFDLCVDALINKSKDLLISAWLLETLIQKDNYLGLSTGLELIFSMCERFWDSDLHPNIVDHDIDDRISAFHWINKKLVVRIQLLHITQPQSDDHFPYTYVDYIKMNKFESLSPKEKENVQHAITMDQFKQSAVDTPLEIINLQQKELQKSLKIIKKLNDFLDEKCGKDAPGLKQFSDAISNILKCINIYSQLHNKVNHIENEIIETNTEDKTFGNSESLSDNFNDNQKVINPVNIQSRDEAYQLLIIASNYLKQKEPHSPVSHLVNRAISWRDMNLMELYAEIFTNKEELTKVNKLLGLKQ